MTRELWESAKQIYDETLKLDERQMQMTRGYPKNESKSNKNIHTEPPCFFPVGFKPSNEMSKPALITYCAKCNDSDKCFHCRHKVIIIGF